MDDRVLAAMAKVPRHAFVPDQFLPLAYANTPLPIGCGKTISQPFIVALMVDLLEIEPEHKVLEIGTGLGYQAAVLAELSHQVYTVEIIQELAIESESGCAPPATSGRIFGSATVRSAGRTTRPSTGSSSPPRRS